MNEFQMVLEKLLSVQNELAIERKSVVELETKIFAFEQQAPAPDRADVERMLRALHENKKIEAIKYCRALTGLGLKEAKDLIEAATSPENRD